MANGHFLTTAEEDWFRVD